MRPVCINGSTLLTRPVVRYVGLCSRFSYIIMLQFLSATALFPLAVDFIIYYASF